MIIDNNEYGLYQTDMILRKDNQFKIVSILGDVRNEKLLDEIFKSNQIDTVFHRINMFINKINPLQAIENNIFLKIICEKSRYDKNDSNIIW